MPGRIRRAFGQRDHAEVDIRVDQHLFFGRQGVADQLAVRRIDLCITAADGQRDDKTVTFFCP